MKRYKDIIDYFGIRNQMKKFNEESYELNEAIANYIDVKATLDDKDDETDGFYMIFREAIVEEMADVLLLCTQFIAEFNIDNEELNRWMDAKLERTEQRIKSGYYLKQLDDTLED